MSTFYRPLLFVYKFVKTVLPVGVHDLRERGGV